MDKRQRICLRYLYFKRRVVRRFLIINTVRIVMGANFVKASISLFLVSILVLVLALMKATVGPTAVRMLLLLACIGAA